MNAKILKIISRNDFTYIFKFDLEKQLQRISIPNNEFNDLIKLKFI